MSKLIAIILTVIFFAGDIAYATYEYETAYLEVPVSELPTFNTLKIQGMGRDPIYFFHPNYLPIFSQPNAVKVKDFGRLKVDQFSFSDNRTFQLRYLYNDSFWMKDGPIFFYTGNEGRIEIFAENTGFLWDMAIQFKAFVLFAEHRYYGSSLPFGNDSFKTVENRGYLTSEQALSDFVDVIDHIKRDHLKLVSKKEHVPVIAFGGSYGGMLAAWMRMKYPAVIQGALASSAPIWQFTGMTTCDSYNEVLTAAFNRTSHDCVKNIRKSWDVLAKAQKSDEDRQWLNQNWKLCTPLQSEKDIPMLIDWISGMYSTLAMTNYPYAAGFLVKLPAYPVKVYCSFLNTTLDEKPLLSALFQSLQATVNYNGKADCLDWLTSPFAALGADGWSIQSCNEMVMPMCANGVTDMFTPQQWNYTLYADNCYRTFGIRPRENMAEKQYGGKNIDAASNIIFSNGLLDPWSSGGVMHFVSSTTFIVLMENSAHHLDLRSRDPNDPPDVIKARKLYANIFHRWIREYRKQYRVAISPYDEYVSSLRTN